MLKTKRRITQAYFDIARFKYAPLVQKLAYSISIDNAQIEDLKARAKDEILRCMICYDGRGSFMTFLYSRLSGVFRHMRDAEQKARRMKTVPLEFVSSMVESNHDMDSNIAAQECLECLNDNEHDIITEIYFNNKTMREIASDHGVSVSSISRIKTSAVNRMRQKCKVELE